MLFTALELVKFRENKNVFYTIQEEYYVVGWFHTHKQTSFESLMENVFFLFL